MLEQLEARASAWNLEMNDEDIEADLLLVDQFIGNLEALGAVPVNPNDPYNDPCVYGSCHQGDDTSGGFFGCSTANATDSAPIALLVLLALLALVRRRRG